jgi:hypothetical protein
MLELLSCFINWPPSVGQAKYSQNDRTCREAELLRWKSGIIEKERKRERERERKDRYREKRERSIG